MSRRKKNLLGQEGVAITPERTGMSMGIVRPLPAKKKETGIRRRYHPKPNFQNKKTKKEGAPPT